MLTKFFLLRSNNIFRALSFESSLLECCDLKLNNYVLFWLSNPCVVIGRHQNPWKEVNIPLLQKSKVILARRASGGGSVYHDLGNLNISFLTNKATCNREMNMSIIVNALNKNWNKGSYNGKRHEIYVENSLKISGSASRFGRHNAFHHCTLLLDANLRGLSEILKSNLTIETNASQSICSDVTNLHLNPMDVIEAIQKEYVEYQQCPLSDVVEIDEGKEDEFVDSLIFQKNFKQFSSHDWIYKTTPNFVIKKEFSIGNVSTTMSIFCEKAVVQDISLTVHHDVSEKILEVVKENVVGVGLSCSELNYRLELSRMKLQFHNDGIIHREEETIFNELKTIFDNL